MRRIGTDRSRIECYQHCERERWLTYHESGTGIVPVRKSLALAVGGAVHKGLEQLLLGANEDVAVEFALTDFSKFQQGALDIGSEVTVGAIAASADGDGGDALLAAAPVVPAPYEDYLYREQAALVEGMVRAYARRRLRPLLEEFEVLEVEREGEWLLYSQPGMTHLLHGDGSQTVRQAYELSFLSRPDALLRSRADGSLVLLSYKTTGAWDDRKARDAQHDMQGLSEGIEIERRLGERILAVRYEYLLKGERWKDKALAARYSIDWARSQKSPLIRAYQAVSKPQRSATSYKVGDLCWSWDYMVEGGQTSKLAWQNWESRLVTELGMTVREWIDKLDSAAETVEPGDATLGIEPRTVGWSSDAQAIGYTTRHPLDSVFLAPITVYRNDDELRDLVEQIEAQETRVAEAVAEVQACGDEDEKRSALNRLFPQTRRACEYPSTCAFVKVCYGGEDIRREPLASGLYRRREPNHPKEAEFHEQAK